MDCAKCNKGKIVMAAMIVVALFFITAGLLRIFGGGIADKYIASREAGTRPSVRVSQTKTGHTTRKMPPKPLSPKLGVKKISISGTESLSAELNGRERRDESNGEGLFETNGRADKEGDILAKTVMTEEHIIADRISIPPPLILGAKQPAVNANLTAAGVIVWTNEHRVKNGLKPLIQNTLLDAAAKIKLDDMFGRQYFEHISPAGKGPDDVIKSAGYSFLIVGENLAMGNTFRNDEELVRGWMESPGHRANILSDKYQQIGVAVGKGVYNGTEVWMGVQEFGVPSDVCPLPPEDENASIQEMKNSLDTRKLAINVKQKELEQADKNKTQEYNQKVNEYNVSVNEYNLLLEKYRLKIANYNKAIDEYNACLELFKTDNKH